jgi:DNA repair protein RadC
MFTVKEMPQDDRPREKLLAKGAAQLSDAELLAILLRTGMKGTTVIDVARNLLKTYGNLASLAIQNQQAFIKIPGIGNDKAATLLAAFELSKRIMKQSKWTNDTIKSPEDVANIFIPLLRDEMREQFIVVCLNSSNKIIRYETISTGSLDSSIVHPREVFKVAIDYLSKSIILVHNHPSGNEEPSREDISITKRLVEAGKILDINIFDHLIIAGSGYTSFAERRLL